MTDSISPAKSFLSLKWQAVISVSLVLIFSFGLLTINGRSNLEQTFESERERVFFDRQKAVSASLDTIKLQLQRLAGHMQGQAILIKDTTRSQALIQTIATHWDQLNFDWGVDSITILSPSNNVSGHWGQEIGLETFPVDWLETARSTEATVSQVWCPTICTQVAIVPVILERGSIGLMILSSSLADAVLYFQTITDADIGILVDHQRQTESADHQLISWRYDLAALTGAPTTYEVLKELSKERKFAEVKDQRNIRQWNWQFYEVSFIPLTASLDENIAQLVVIDNVTTEMNRLDTTLRYLVIASAIALILTEAVLLAMLWLPMLRLQKVSQVLPLLANNTHRKINKLLTPSIGKAVIRNEIHELYDSTISLSHTLEELDKMVESRTSRLKNRSQELLQEKNFVTSLLNNVHIVILTQDYNSNIKLLNSEGKRIIDFDEESEKDFKFVNQLEDEDKVKFFDGLEKLNNGTLTEFRHELDFVDMHGNPLHMEWFHSVLPKSLSEGDLILSVGLDLTARKIAEKNLAWLADHDPLTELFNRRRFQKEFERVLKYANRNNKAGALIFFDIDQFKAVNDTSGHPMGDQLLREIAKKLKSSANPRDIIARLGGDEFAILLEECGSPCAIKFAEDFCDAIKHTKISNNGSTHRISLSMGIAVFPDHGKAADELMANADLAMYRAKATSNARSNWELYSSQTQDKEELYHRINWKQQIEHALENDRFVLYFQPILDIRSGYISHYESLVRMIDDSGKIIPPITFIPVAEQTGLIYEIDVHIVRLAVKALRAFHQYDPDISLSVNLSARALSNKQFINLVEQCVKSSPLERSKLLFELTETSALEDVDAAAQEIERFKKLGYRFAIDDFGVGFSSWYYLRQLPVDYVKIDGSFVRKLSSNMEDRLFVKAINDVAQGLGKKTIAEFVEDQYSLALLSAMGVNYAQGYQIGKPQPLDVTLESLAEPLKQ